MKTEQGLVIEVSDNVAKIKVGRHNDCKNCGACPGNDSIVITATNKIGAKPGQRVAFEVKESNFLMATFVVFVLPIIALFIGVLLGGVVSKYIGSNIRISQIIGGIIMFVLSLIFVKSFDKTASANNKSQPVIVRIL
ncbi:SoxR reducing system RseC family protein [Clostridium saccharobutylicum]|uniref:Positive regulator of sigma E, RseC/MucC n=1 Tax=Clostridium saccharobutylicum DSM 13864 TaxID=1345695 RepID=U5MQ71_CLOSA|nr:SoxR reducing system RseC family protein [Clostridium saccharobutylicum]AGX41572.1 positive regulator of sigma E, RseC/MucC [Clostridium saccharobutylicum DSM 13864]AQR88852.1 SoxR reducing system protein RseC [Clostridium saccharobutylicum]AQR98751.1 SoxR reducing system protein RseC [Clostridium saccharobutylicum]AQS12741.1 SoxR reducing system protein RseC [Clostridium saccharobutylicum]MBA2904149.1 sigma-E factor negative regulatory protein RseC [Clostridium saccharobutylicum]